MALYSWKEVKNATRETICGTISGIAGVSFGYPLDTIKVTPFSQFLEIWSFLQVRLQTQNIYTGIIDVFMKTVRTQGVAKIHISFFPDLEF